MKKYKVLIIGGGVAGLSCALTLASSKDTRGFEQNMEFLVIDDGNSDLKKSRLYNVPGIEWGTLGKDALEGIKQQVQKFGNVEFIEGQVTRVDGSLGKFSVYTNDQQFITETIVLATGFHGFNVEGLDIKLNEYNRVPRPDLTYISVDQESKIKDGIYVTGLAAGVSTMFACAAGSGTQVACNIFETYIDSPNYVHDMNGSRK